jgi:putative restriction endonuclease
VQNDLDLQIRLAAVDHLRRTSAGGVLSSDDLRAGFHFHGERIPVVNPQRGIFKPASMEKLLSVRTVFPRSGRKVWYDDQRLVHEQIERGDETVDYAFMGDDPNAADNRWLRDARDQQTPILYFLGVAPQRYSLVWPTYIVDWSASELKARIAFGAPLGLTERRAPDAPERKYAFRMVRQRLHQATFREAVLAAYANRCAFTGLPEPRLLDAAHIVNDGDEMHGQPVVSNGLPLSKMHHAAFDANLIGIDPDLRIHIAPALLLLNDGPMFEQGVKALVGRLVRLPARAEDRPDPNRLALRFEQFRAAM